MEMQSIDVTSGVGSRDLAPYVQILIKAADWYTQMDPATARELAANLLEAAEAAETDAFLMDWARDVAGVADVEKRAGLLHHLREYRDKRRDMAQRDKRKRGR